MQSTLPWLCSLCLTLALTLSASGQDFAILDAPEQPALSFALFGEADTQLPAAEEISFAVLDPCKECNCEQTGVCLCDDCTCPNCPRNAKPDNRPVITAKVKDGCPPCVVLKSDSKTEALSGFRFRFVETSGDAPVVEWQGLDAKYSITGWHGVDFFKRAYDRSQRPPIRSSRVSYRPAPVRMPRYFAPQPSFGGCAGGVCRSCR